MAPGPCVWHMCKFSQEFFCFNPCLYIVCLYIWRNRSPELLLWLFVFCCHPRIFSDTPPHCHRTFMGRSARTNRGWLFETAKEQLLTVKRLLPEARRAGRWTSVVFRWRGGRRIAWTLWLCLIVNNSWAGWCTMQTDVHAAYYRVIHSGAARCRILGHPGAIWREFQRNPNHLIPTGALNAEMMKALMPFSH